MKIRRFDSSAFAARRLSCLCILREVIAGVIWGSFILQHSSTMNRGVQQQNITVVPQSGTAELAGLEGRMIIRIEGGKHYYDFDYKLGGQ